MSAPKHTPGPWKLLATVTPDARHGSLRYYDVLAPSRLGPVAVVNPAHRDGDFSEGDANAARIVACVNACEGIEDPGKAEITFTDYGDGEPCTIEANTVAELLTDAGKLLEQQSKDLSDLRRKYAEAIEALKRVHADFGEACDCPSARHRMHCCWFDAESLIPAAADHGPHSGDGALAVQDSLRQHATLALGFLAGAARMGHEGASIIAEGLASALGVEIEPAKSLAPKGSCL